MNTRKIIAIILVVIGVGCLGMSHYINQQVLGGQAQVDSAQRSVDQGNKLFSINPVSKEVGKTLTSPIQRKIDAGQAEVLYYARIAQILQVGGIILILAGLVVFFIPKRR